jgi:hypothetical protein
MIAQSLAVKLIVQLESRLGVYSQKIDSILDLVQREVMLGGLNVTQINVNEDKVVIFSSNSEEIEVSI